MSKTIQITEHQFNKLKNNMLLESTQSQPLVAKNVRVEFDLNERNIDGRYVYGVLPIEITLGFNIHVYFKSYGIDTIFINNFSGPKVLDIELEVEALTDEDSDEILEHTIHLDWSDAEVTYENCDCNTPFGVDNILIVLDSSLFVEKILIYPYCD